MVADPRELTGAEQVDVAEMLAKYASEGGVAPRPILMQLGVSTGIFNFYVPDTALWLEIVKALHSGRSREAGFRSDAVARLIDVVARQLQGNEELSRLSFSLAPDRSSGPSGQRAIFLSYSRTSRAEVDALYDALHRKDAGCTVFQDHRSIDLGRDWLDEIRSAAGTASIMACWLTADYFKSAFCNYEIGIADSCGVSVIPIRVDSGAGQRAPSYLARPQMLRPAIPFDFDAIAQELIDQL
ncbi:MAG: TIR domain-containing protein [Planctomycetes bacterium]|nr:TIR domain-containing protein [Planctomycetota bacterium]